MKPAFACLELHGSSLNPSITIWIMSKSLSHPQLPTHEVKEQTVHFLPVISNTSDRYVTKVMSPVSGFSVLSPHKKAHWKLRYVPMLLVFSQRLKKNMRCSILSNNVQKHVRLLWISMKYVKYRWRNVAFTQNPQFSCGWTVCTRSRPEWHLCYQARRYQLDQPTMLGL